jgi:hypothetical protein
MGNIGRRLGYGVGQGLQVFGTGLERSEIRKKEEARYEQESKLREERHKADLEAMDIRNEQLKLANTIKRVELNNNRLVQTFNATKGDPRAVTEAITKYGAGPVEIYDEAESRRKSKELGKPVIVVNTGVWKTNEKDVPITDPTTGDKIFEPFPGSAGQIVRTPEEFTDHFADVVNPNVALARMHAKMTYKDIYNKAVAHAKGVAEVKEQAELRAAQTPEGKLEQRKLAAETKLAEKEAAGLQTGPAVTEVQDVLNRKVTRTHTEAQGDLAAMKIMARDNPEWGVTSPEQAFRINQLKNDPELRRLLAADVTKALKDEAHAEKLVRQGSKKMGIPAEFLQNMLIKAAEDEEAIEASKGGIVNWFKEFFSGKGKAPKAYDTESKAPGGLVF